MKIKISNLGVSKQAEIELKPLTVFIGHNNTGKTWTAYTLAAIFGRYGLDRYLEEYRSSDNPVKYPLLDAVLEQLIKQGFATIDVVQFIKDYSEIYFNEVAKTAPKWLNSFFATQRVNFEDVSIQVQLEDTPEYELIFFSPPNKDFRLGVGEENPKGILSIFQEWGKKEMVLYLQSDGINQIPKSLIQRFIYNTFSQIIRLCLYKSIYIFPTERANLSVFLILPNTDINPEEMNEYISKFSAKIKPNPYYISDFSRFLNLASKIDIYEREKQDNPFINLSKTLEYILDGKLEFEPRVLDKELIFQTSDNIKLEMPVVSSMVKGLAPLLLYLRYLAQPNDLIIIDEPEMNLHPSTQVEIIEFLAMLVNAGLNIIITTQSPYIIDHLSNLMKAAKHEDPDSIKDRFYLEKKESFISQDKVSVYLFEDGTARNILDEEGLIDWSTFSSVSHDIAYIF